MQVPPEDLQIDESRWRVESLDVIERQPPERKLLKCCRSGCCNWNCWCCCWAYLWVDSYGLLSKVAAGIRWPVCRPVNRRPKARPPHYRDYHKHHCVRPATTTTTTTTTTAAAASAAALVAAASAAPGPLLVRCFPRTINLYSPPLACQFDMQSSLSTSFFRFLRLARFLSFTVH